MNNRIEGLDILRGFAIVLMIIFHLSYDLNYFGFVDINITSDPFWLNFRSFIVTLFLIVVGISLALTHKNGIKWQKIKKRVVVLFLASSGITLITYIIFPKKWVYFGILHSILILSIIALPFINRGYLSLFLAVIIIVGYNFFNMNMHPLFNILKNPLHLPAHTVDLAPIIPWFSVVLIGVAIVAFNWHKKIFRPNIFNSITKFHTTLKFLGRHALLIYLIHQPILFGIVWLIIKF